MSIRRLKTLIAIAETDSFAEAARIVSLTPAAVGQQIKRLEEDLGIAIFDRNKRSPQLNPLGQALVPRARELIHAYNHLITNLTEESFNVQELTIGAVDTTMAGLVPKVLANLQQEYGHIHIRVVPGLSGDLYPQVDRGTLDAAIISEPGQVYDHLRWRPFVEEPLIVIAPPDASSDDPVELLESFPYIRFSRLAWVGEQIDEWLIAGKVRINESMELTTLESISTMVSYGLGASIVPGHCVAPSSSPVLKRVPLHPPARPRRLGVLSRRDSSVFRMIDLFLAEIVRVVSAAGEMPVLPQST
jgi:DNA-binding transcriptional LysR family regulator